MKTPEYKDIERAMKLRRNSKQGYPVSFEEIEFCDKLRKKFPEWYQETQQEIFESTKPFGAR